jgi:putative acetyltransferase
MTTAPIQVRPEAPADHDAVYRVHERAFGRADEAHLVERLRREAHPHLSLVAEAEGDVVGHIFFSPVKVESPGDPSGNPPVAMGLAPMAVLPGRQQQGIGTQLVHEGVAACRRQGVEALVVLGHPDYYPRFGFRPARTWGLRCTYDVPEEAFMAMAVKKGALRDRSGTVRYHPAFDAVE